MKKKSLKNWIKNHKVQLIIFFIYLVVTFVTIVFHEAWEDEAQAWLTVRDCSLFELIGRMKVEGHFLPWYLIIMPFAKLGFPYITQNLLSWLICSVSAWLFLEHLPTKLFKRAIFIFTLPMIYLFPVISRCYCLIPLATIFLIMSYKNRFSHPFRYALSIVLMSVTHISCFMFSFILGIEFFLEWIKLHKSFPKGKNRRIVASFCLAIILVILSFLPLFGSLNGASGIYLDASSFDIKHFLFGNVIFYLGKFSSFVPIQITFLLAGFYAAYLLNSDKKLFLLFCLCVLWQFSLSEFLFPITIIQRVFIPVFYLVFFLSRREKATPSPRTLSPVGFTLVMLLLLYIIFETGNLFYSSVCFSLVVLYCLPKVSKKLWNRDYTPVFKRLGSLALLSLALISVTEGIFYIYNDINYTFTDSKTTANYIESELIKPDTPMPIFLTDLESSIIFSSIIAHVKNPSFRMYDMNIEKYYTYSIQLIFPEDFKSEEKDLASVCESLDKEADCYYIVFFNDTRDVLAEFLSDDSSLFQTQLASGKINKIFDSSIYEDGWDNTANEHYRIYKVSTAESAQT
ncbi:hypothetical protein IJG20_03405 [Candidatus Saccharibacteria bacterium]|nr:hypothetical protein [Candidatus Saccharibacteria bacterium]